MLALRHKFYHIRGVYGMCPMLQNTYPHPDCPSHTAWCFPRGMASHKVLQLEADCYTANEADKHSPLAWPALATVEDLRGFPPLVLVANECDCHCDEAINLHRVALKAGVRSRCSVKYGTIHGSDMQFALLPDVTSATVSDILHFVQSL